MAILLPPIVAGAAMLLVLSPILLPMMREATQFSFMVRPTSDLYILSATVMDFFVPNRLHTLWRQLDVQWPGNQIAPLSERTIAIGYLALLLAGVALWQQRRSARFWLGSALFFFLLALGPTWHWHTITAAMIPNPNAVPSSWTPFELLNELVPFMRISRSVSRYALMVQLSVAVLAGLGLAYLLDAMDRTVRKRTSARSIVAPIPLFATVLLATLLLAGVLFESCGALSHEPTRYTGFLP
ncbi:MAG: hypothetical protein R2867_36235 [Caldilineaceae bacterium]